MNFFSLSQDRVRCADENQMEQAARVFATEFISQNSRPRFLLLNGDLGAGKTLFCRALIQTFSQNFDLNVPSPTYSLLQIYETQYGSIWHYDLYRLNDPAQLDALSWEDALSQAFLVLVEWPERLQYYRPKNALSLDIDIDENNHRVLHLTEIKA
jgi:tRNA threonylcarbamoyladenosine biosynthesis protein TsaE